MSDQRSTASEMWDRQAMFMQRLRPIEARLRAWGDELVAEVIRLTMMRMFEAAMAEAIGDSIP